VERDRPSRTGDLLNCSRTKRHRAPNHVCFAMAAIATLVRPEALGIFSRRAPAPPRPPVEKAGNGAADDARRYCGVCVFGKAFACGSYVAAIWSQ
jgi:hypothetical protein